MNINENNEGIRVKEPEVFECANLVRAFNIPNEMRGAE